MTLRALLLIASMLLVSVVVCRPDFEVIQASALRVRWGNSLRDTSASWWYAGDDRQYHYLLEKRPFATRGFKVRRDDVMLASSLTMPLSFDSEGWINLKVGDIDFK